MTYRVLSARMKFEQGSVVDASDLSGNIDALVAAGHLEPVAAERKTKKVQEPEPVPALQDDSAEEPEEQD